PGLEVRGTGARLVWPPCRARHRTAAPGSCAEPRSCRSIGGSFPRWAEYSNRRWRRHEVLAYIMSKNSLSPDLQICAPSAELCATGRRAHPPSPRLRGEGRGEGQELAPSLSGGRKHRHPRRVANVVPGPPWPNTYRGRIYSHAFVLG